MRPKDIRARVLYQCRTGVQQYVLAILNPDAPMHQQQVRCLIVNHYSPTIIGHTHTITRKHLGRFALCPIPSSSWPPETQALINPTPTPPRKPRRPRPDRLTRIIRQAVLRALGYPTT